MSWQPTTIDSTADWSEVADWLLGTAKALGKTIAGQEPRVGALRSRREVALDELGFEDTGAMRKGPSTETLWTAVLVLNYPGRLKDGAHAAALADAQAIGDALTTGNPGRGWRVHVPSVRIAGTEAPDTIRVRMTVTVLTVWRHGAAQGTSPTSAEATANGGLT